eukprot:GHRQ01020222.1.p1 GENE.GHRQ01020222.1~~GHRQ01020222.1.p1  ORF type:complete len:452 (+),score=111.69 GHRQ01020222.1:388-1743(+)
MPTHVIAMPSSWLARQAITTACIWSTASWVFCVHTHLHGQKHGLRAMLCLPCAALHFALLPYLVDSKSDPLSVLPTTGLLSFAAFKIIALVMSRGVLMHVPQQYWHFMAACCLPIIPEAAFAASRASKHTSAGSRQNSIHHEAASLLSRAACGMFACAALHIHWLPRLAVYWLYMFITCMFLGAATDCFALLTTVLLGMRLAPSFDRPYLSGSLTEFWSQRWNVTTTYLFRVMVYDPIVEQQLVAGQSSTAARPIESAEKCPQHTNSTAEHIGSSNGTGAVRQRARQAPALQQSLTLESSGQEEIQQLLQHAEDTKPDSVACSSQLTNRRSKGKPADASNVRRYVGLQMTFVVSAAWHLLMFFAMTGTFGWRWMWFFTAQGPLLLLESRVSKVAKAAGVRMPRVLAVLLTNMLLIVMADPLLIAPMVESGMVEGCFHQARMVVGVVLQQVA